MDKRPNILFLFADDMRFDTIHCLGNPDIKTPHLDALFARGAAFTNANIPGGTCAAVCMPSRAMLNTGRTLFHLEDHGASIPQEHALLGETLQQAGYNTFGTGKWHNGAPSFARSFSAGSEIFFGGMYDHWKVPVYDYDDTGDYVKTWNDVMNPGYTNAMQPVRANHVNWGKHSTDLFADAACDYIDGYQDEKPFYMYVSYMAPHDPRSMPQEFFDLYDVDQIPLPENYLPEHPFDYGVWDVRDERLEAYPRTPEAIKRHTRDYYAMISHLDASIGRIIESLKKSGRLENTIVLFSADNGLGIGRHGLMGKQNCYEHSIRMPLAFAGPGIPPGVTREGAVYLMDIFPTLCELTGTPVPDTVEGTSFKRLLMGETDAGRAEIFFCYRDKIRGIKDAQYKLIEYRFRDEHWSQLFDLKRDPHEQTNLADDPAHADARARLYARLQATATALGDEALPWGQHFWRDTAAIEPEPFGFV